MISQIKNSVSDVKVLSNTGNRNVCIPERTATKRNK